MYKGFVNLLVIVALLAGLFCPLLTLTSRHALAQTTEALIEEMITRMSVEERVGQLFLVTFFGDDSAPPSDIAELIQIYRVGGAVLLPSNGNISNQENTAVQTAALIRQLQELALSTPATTTAYADFLDTGETVTQIPLFIAVDHEGDAYPYTRLINEFSPVPSNMAIGATWSDELAQSVGEVVGLELSAVGVNMLLGPSLDVLDSPRPGVGGDLGTRTFGGDPYWVGRLGEAYLRGVHLGSDGRVATVAKHFPGHGGSDRRADEEVSTVNKSLQELYRIELAPFFVATRKSKIGSPSITDALMTSHIRYRGFQGNIRQLTRPISFDAQNLPALMRLPEFVPWREAGGLLVSDALGVPAVRRYYDPQLQTFPYRQIAQEAFLAGNDLLLLSQFALTDAWPAQFENIKATIAFFQDKYVNDATFRQRVDESLYRILKLKLQLYAEFTAEEVLTDPEGLAVVGQGTAVVSQVAKSAITLIYPGQEELADRLPSPPLPDEQILIFTDSRLVSDCADPERCPPYPSIGPEAIETIMLRLYGPMGSEQVLPERVHSLTFADLRYFLTEAEAEPAPNELMLVEDKETVDNLISEAKWLVFAMIDTYTERYPSADVLRQFLRMSELKLRNKNLIVFAFSEPYYLDTTEISKLTAYYGLYSKVPPFIDAAVRTLFQEVTPSGASPVSIAGVNYDLITITEPDPDQIIHVNVAPATESEDDVATPVGISVGGTLDLIAGPVIDRKGHIVPDGTPVEFRLFYPADSIELPRLRSTTVNGMAESSVVLDRTGQLNVTASSGNALRSTTLQVTIEGNDSVQIATLVPTPTYTPTPTDTPIPPTPTPTDTPTLIPTATSSPTATAVVEPTAEPVATAGPVQTRTPGFSDLALSLLVLVSLSSVVGVIRGLAAASGPSGLRLFLWLMIGGLAGYVLFAQEFLPSSLTDFLPPVWAAPLVSLAGVGFVVGVSLLFRRRR